MGYWKERMIEFQQRGYGEVPDKYVCKKHFDDYAVIDFINSHSEEGGCSYCEPQEQVGHVVSLEIFMEFLNDGITSFYADPDNEGVGYNSGEGGYQGAETFDTYDLLKDKIILEIDNEDLFQDIFDCYGLRSWCYIDPYAPSESEGLLFDWDYFSRLLKHKVRYVFFKTNHFDNENEYKRTYEILDEVGERLNQLGLVKEIKAGQKFYRARQHHSSSDIKAVKDLAAPTEEQAVYPNRMSPAGIPMFYGAFDEKTASEETIDYENKDKDLISLGAFVNKDSLNVIDFVDLPPIPSIFDEKKRKNYYSILFFKSFVRDLSRPIKKDGKEHIEYVPTQVVTEYLRYVFSEVSKVKVDGILYRSSKQVEKICCVLFFDQRESLEKLDIDFSKIITEKIEYPSSGCWFKF